jgi:hypothetical protein
VFLSRPSAQLGHTLVAPTAHLTHVVDDFTSTAYLNLQGLIYRVGRALTRIVPTGMHYRMPRPGPVHALSWVSEAEVRAMSAATPRLPIRKSV